MDRRLVRFWRCSHNAESITYVLSIRYRSPTPAAPTTLTGLNSCCPCYAYRLTPDRRAIAAKVPVEIVTSNATPSRIRNALTVDLGYDCHEYFPTIATNGVAVLDAVGHDARNLSQGDPLRDA